MRIVVVTLIILFLGNSYSADSDIFCPELGNVLGNFSSTEFTHILRNPECFDKIKPILTFYTTNRGSSCSLLEGCQLSLEDLNSRSSSINELFNDINKLVFLVHGFQMEMVKSDLK